MLWRYGDLMVDRYDDRWERSSQGGGGPGKLLNVATSVNTIDGDLGAFNVVVWVFSSLNQGEDAIVNSSGRNVFLWTRQSY